MSVALGVLKYFTKMILKIVHSLISLLAHLSCAKPFLKNTIHGNTKHAQNIEVSDVYHLKEQGPVGRLRHRAVL